MFPPRLPATLRALPLALLLLAPAEARAAQATGPMEQVRQATEALLATLRDPALKAPERKAERRKKIEDTVTPSFNWRDIAQRALATHWRDRTEDERAQVTALLCELVRRTYMSRLESYSNEQMLYDTEEIDGAYARVGVRIVTTKNTEVPLTYSMKRYDTEWLVYDVSIEGVRLVNNYRTQFRTMLDSMSFDKFLEKLKQKVDKFKDE